jgi:hypothetical protein
MNSRFIKLPHTLPATLHDDPALQLRASLDIQARRYQVAADASSFGHMNRKIGAKIAVYLAVDDNSRGGYVA